MDATREDWRPIPTLLGYYEASDLGRVRSVTRQVNHVSGGRVSRGRVLCACPLPNDGYLQVRVGVKGVRRTHSVHRLVCEAFHGEPLPGQQVRHLNGLNTDNRPENLQWGTASENAYDRVRHGTHTNGNVKKTRCPRGHLLQAPNLRLNTMKLGYRNCRSCEYAGTYVRRNPDADFDREADRYYRRFRPDAEEA